MESLFGRHGDIKPENILWFDSSELKSELILTLADIGWVKLHKQNILELKDLQRKVQKSRSDVQHHLNLGWIGVYEMLAERDLGVDNLMDLWQKFHSFLLLLQHIFLKLEKILALWEKVLYLLLLYLSFSEFPNRLRPPCTTMPWTIWPVLVVLWGVCWMFYEELNWNWGDQGELPTTGSTTGLFDDIGHIDPSQVFDSDSVDISYNMSMWNVPNFDAPNLEQQLRLCIPGPATTSDTAISLDSAVNPADTVSLPVINHEITSGVVATPSFTSCPATSTIQRATENRQLEAIELKTLVPLTSLIHRQPRDGQVGPSRSSKHGQTEKYFCTYSDCIHSQLGSGFKRKDHLDQHLRGLHKQTSVQRLRAKPAAASSIANLTAISDITGVPLQSKKRKRGSEEETSGSNLDKLEKELVEERRLRRLVEEDNHLLRQKSENYKRRMEKYEEQLDRMMTLLEEHQREEGG